MCSQYSPGEAALASEATNFYKQCQLGPCMSHMRKLYSARPTDPKVMANKALVDFIYQNKLTRSDEYLTQLQKAASLAGSPINVKGGTNVQGASGLVSALDPSIISIHYNYALVLFYQRRYLLSERLLASLIGLTAADTPASSTRFLISAGSLLSQRCILLWLDVCFCLQRFQRVFDFTSYWLQRLDSSGENGETLASETSEVLSEIIRPLHVFRLRACLLLGKINIAQEEVNRLSQSYDPGVDKNWNTSKSLEYGRAQLSYLEGDYIKAVKSLNSLLTTESISPSSTDWEAALVWNNLSLVYFRSGQLGLAALEARAALRRVERLANEATGATTDLSQLIRRTPLPQLNASRHHELLYNTGVQLLLGQKYPEAAFNVLLTVIKAYPRNPRLWLRLAECCVRIHSPNNLTDWRPESRASSLFRTVGTGAARKLIIDSDEESKKSVSNSASTSEAAPTLEFAIQCLRNAAFLLPRPPIELDISTTPSDQLPVDRIRSALFKWADEWAIPVPPSSQPLSGMALLQVISSVLLTSAYVALCLEDPVEAIYYAEQLLSVGPPSPRPTTTDTFVWIGLVAPPAHRYLAKMYLAEARVAIDEVAEANVALLSRDCISSVERSPALPVHALRSYTFLQRECACLSPAFLMPQTHPFCGLRTDTAAHPPTSGSGLKSSNSDLQRLIQIHKEQREAEPILCKSINPKTSDFPFLVDQAIGVLWYNLAVCAALRGDVSGARQLLENATPSLLVNCFDPGSRAPIRHGSEDHQRLLYPTDVSMNSISRLLNTHHLPGRFLRLWLYLEMREDRAFSAIQFLRAHIGAVEFENFSDIGAKEVGRDEGGDGAPTVLFRADSGMEHPDVYAAELRRNLSAPGPLRSDSSSRPVPLQISDPPPPPVSSSSTSAATPCWNEADWPPL